MNLDQIELFLQNTIFPELEKGRSNWDKPHTICVVNKIKSIIDASPELNLDRKVLVIAAYAHDWGYSGLFENGKELQLDEVKSAKKEHARIGEIKIRGLLKNPVFNDLSDIQKERICHLVKVHDEVSILKDPDELVLMEADTLAGLDINAVKPTFNEESNQRYINGVLNGRIPRFLTGFSKSQSFILLKSRENYYSQHN